MANTSSDPVGSEVEAKGPCWLFDARQSYGGHYTVTVRCGPKPHNRALVGHLTMTDTEWFALREILRQGPSMVKQSWWKGPVEFSEHRLPTANDIGV